MLNQHYVLISFFVAAPLTIICVAILICLSLLLLLSLFDFNIVTAVTAAKCVQATQDTGNPIFSCDDVDKVACFFWTAWSCLSSVSVA